MALIAKLARNWAELGPVGFSYKAARVLGAGWERWRQGPSDLSFDRFLKLQLVTRSLDTFNLCPWLDPGWIQTLPQDERESILRRAQDVLDHRFDLLGSGPTDLGTPIPWRTDFKSGREWPLDPMHAIAISYPDSSDIKVPWELSRFQHLPLLGQAWWLTSDPRYPQEFESQIRSWWDQNPLEKGPNWACTMDVAIRAANWIYGAWAFCDAPLTETFLPLLFHSLYLHGRFIRRHLEEHQPQGNHYLANLTGLLHLGALFPDTPEDWWTFAQSALEDQMMRQVHPDGVNHEASISYHRLVAEMMTAADHLGKRIQRPFSPAFQSRLAAMRQFTAHYLRDDGSAPQMGDCDNGRWHLVSDYGRFNPLDHRHLFSDWGDPLPAAPGSRAFAEGGFFILRHEAWHLTVHCGSTGLGGHGGHGHNDLLAFELFHGPHPLIVDSGTWLYTADPSGRNLFRQTAMHATLEVDGQEQNPLASHQLFRLPDRTHARCLTWEETDQHIRFVGDHLGYAPVRHQREIVLHKDPARITIVDLVDGTGQHALLWSFPFPELPFRLEECGGLETTATDRPNFRLQIEPKEGLSWEVVPCWYSPGYGIRHPNRRLCYRWTGPLPMTMRFEVSLT